MTGVVFLLKLRIGLEEKKKYSQIQLRFHKVMEVHYWGYLVEMQSIDAGTRLSLFRSCSRLSSF